MCICLPPSCDRKSCIVSLNTLWSTCSDEDVVIVGDFNEDLLNEKDPKHVHNFIIENPFVQHVKVPMTDYGSLLDHIYTRNIDVIIVNVQDCYYNDHDKTFCFYPKYRD